MEKKGNVLMDVGHNPACMRNLKEAISSLKYERLFIVFGVKDDKDIKSMLYHLPEYEEMFITKYQIAPNGVEPGKIREVLESTGRDVSKVSVIPNVVEALNYAKSVAKKKDLILVTGSTFIVSEARGLERQICS
jgi:dihydrofolate synthase/folylpolyglutamate synthase